MDCWENLTHQTIAVVSCNHVIPKEYRVASQMETAMHYLHADSLFDAMWELLPCSFVVDWLINIDLLDNLLDNQRLTQPSVTDLGYSKKNILTYHTVGRGYNGGFGTSNYFTRSGGSSGNVWEGPALTKSSYLRLKGFPTGTSTEGYFGSGINITHSLDGTALFILAHGI